MYANHPVKSSIYDRMAFDYFIIQDVFFIFIACFHGASDAMIILKPIAINVYTHCLHYNAINLLHYVLCIELMLLQLSCQTFFKNIVSRLMLHRNC